MFHAKGGTCHVCKRKLRPGDDWDLDHMIALSSGGSDDDSNLAPICEGCHALKTKDDTSTAAEGKRRATKHVVPGRFRMARGWRR